MLIFLCILSVALGTALFFAVKYMLKFASIIMMLEDDLSDAADTHKRTSDVLERFAELQIYTDSPEIAKKLQQCREELQLSALATDKLVNTLTARSKHKYIRFEETTRQADSNNIE